jgi:hypothetical protein
MYYPSIARNFNIKIDIAKVLTVEFVLSLSVLVTIFLIFVYQKVPLLIEAGPRLISEASSWTGNKPSGELMLVPSRLTGESVAAVEVNIKRHRFYRVEVSIDCKTQTRYIIDLYGQNYDSSEQERAVSCGKSVKDLIIYSRKAPDTTYLRIMNVDDSNELIVREIQIRELPSYLQTVLYAIIICIFLPIPVTILFYKKYKILFVIFFGMMIFVSYMNFATSVRRDNGSDNSLYIPTAFSILKDGDIDISEVTNDADKFYGNLRLPGSRVVNYFPLGPSLVALPFVFFGNMTHVPTMDIAAITANTIAALSAVTLFLLAGNLGVSTCIALLVTLIFSFGTSQFSIHAGGLWSHNVIVFASLLALYIVTLRDRRWVLTLPFVLLLGYLSRPDFSLMIMAIIGYLLLTDKAKAVQVTAILSVLMLGFMIWCQSTYGSFLPPYYQSSRLSLDNFGSHILGQFFSPNRGLLIYNPIFLVSLWGGVIAFKYDVDHKIMYRLVAIVCLVFFITVACFFHWWGGHSFGPRLHAPMFGLLCVLMLPAMTHPPSSGIPKRLFVTFAVIAVCWGVFVHGRAATRSSVSLWNSEPENVDTHPERLWYWNDMQIFR